MIKRFLDRSLRGLYGALVPARAKNTIRLRLLFEEQDKPPVPLRDFDEESVVVLAPHFDDEVIGCGGALLRHARAGAKICAVFLTDGSRGDSSLYKQEGLDAEAVAAAEASLAKQRKLESENAAKIIGIGELVFLDEPDGALEVRPKVVEGLTAALARAKPQVVYVPSMLDTHLDHWAVNLVLRECVRRGALAEGGVLLRQYEVWTPLVVNRIVEIADVLDTKVEALRQFESQHPEKQLIPQFVGLSHYRSIHRGTGPAEAFFESDVASYCAILDRFAERR